MREHGRSTSRLTVLAVVTLTTTAGRLTFAQTPAEPPVPIAPAASAAPGSSAVARPSGLIDNPIGIPDLRNIASPATSREGVASTLQILVLLTCLSLAPAILIMTTCFTRIVIVLSLLRQAIGVPTLPPSQVIIGLALFMTFAVMGPTWQRIYADALKPWLDGAPGMTQRRAWDVGGTYLRGFMFDQIERAGNEESIYLFYEHSLGKPVPAGATLRRAEVPTLSLIPAFILSELKTAFVMGFRIYLPFLVIDMVIASILVSMGMLMLPPVLISLPFKVLLFVLADGWHLVVGTLLTSFG
jgi:flagellar biosynthetic protein FliP